MNATDDLFRRSQELQWQLTEAREAYFFGEVLFSFEWWLVTAALVGAYIVLWRIADRSRLQPMLIVGLFVLGFSLAADVIGGSFLLWDYPRMAMPWGPRLFSADLIIPVGYMLIYQYFRDRRSYFIACLALSVLYSFVLEPLAVLLGVYEPIQWRFIYSFPIFVGLGLAAKEAADAAERAQRAGEPHKPADALRRLRAVRRSERS